MTQIGALHLNADAIARVFLSLLLAAFLAGCASTRSSSESRTNPSEAGLCIDREAREVAQTKTDLETAALAVIGRCSYYTDAVRRELTDKYPGYRDHIAQTTRQLDELYLSRARSAIAAARANRS